jgi:hypothetical protein
MSASSCALTLQPFPPDLVQAIAQDAVADAHRVALFLDALGLRPTGAGTPLKLPAFFLVGLAAALRLLSWEQSGLHVHRDVGLPSADEALRELAGAVVAPGSAALKEQVARQLLQRVLGVFIERLAWNGRALLEADLELGEADEDALVDALADLLWSHRHDGEGPAPAERGGP